MRRGIAVFMSMICSTAALVAAEVSPKKREAILELIRLSNARAAAAGFMAETLSVSMVNQTAAEKQQLRDQLRTSMELVQPGVDARVVAAYDKSLSLKEVEQLVAFFKSDLGRKYAEAQLTLGGGGEPAGAEKTVEELEAALARSKLLRTRADMLSLATATEAFATDHNYYPDAKTIGELEPHLEPIYIRELPLKDQWGNDFVYIRHADRFSYRFVSGGADGRIEAESLVLKRKPSKKSDDLIYESGEFVQDPSATNN